MHSAMLKALTEGAKILDKTEKMYLFEEIANIKLMLAGEYGECGLLEVEPSAEEMTERLQTMLSGALDISEWGFVGDDGTMEDEPICAPVTHFNYLNETP